ncbi:rhodanese-like domain-containing protein [Photobacterium sagamiensis]|uniref:rhodanese-like domain-containing protein n=1 Tax=Photobacterium sagamiensis TaxID=2910241 RepID=UPI003D143D93
MGIYVGDQTALGDHTRFLDADLSPTLSVSEPLALIEQKLLLSYLINKNTFPLIDARSEKEFKQAHIDSVINIPLTDVNIDKPLFPDKLNKPILDYCKSGKRHHPLLLTPSPEVANESVEC